MKRAVLAIAAAASLSACTPQHPVSAGEIVAKAQSALVKAETAYARARAIAEMILPWLPAERVRQIRAIEARIEAALALARTAAWDAGQFEQIEAAQAATRELTSAAN